jgi:hypothetical protein
MLQVCCIGANQFVRPGHALRGAPTKDENYLYECNPAKTTGIDIETAYREAAQIEIGQSMICLSEFFLQGGWGQRLVLKGTQKTIFVILSIAKNLACEATEILHSAALRSE